MMEQPEFVLPSHCSSCLQCIRQALDAGKTTASCQNMPPEWKILLTDLAALREYTLELSKGNLSAHLMVRGQFAGALKGLQANLRHLTWQVQQVAAGDLTQRVEFMGDFSIAFNKMIENLNSSNQELRASEARYRLLAENSTDVIWMMDQDAHITFVSPSVFRLRGFTPEEVMSQRLDEIFSSESLEKIMQIYTNSLELNVQKKTIPEIRIEVQEKCKWGGLVWTEMITNPVYDVSGEMLGFLGVTRDFSVQRKAKESEQEQRAMAEAMRDSAAALNSALSLDEVLDVLLENIGRVINYDLVDIMRIEEDEYVRIMRSRAGEDSLIDMYPTGQLRLRIADTPNVNEMFHSWKPLLITDIDQYSWIKSAPTMGMHSHLGMPIIADEKIAGFFVVLNKIPDFYSMEHIERLKVFADQAAIAIQKATLFERLQTLATMDSLTGIYNRGNLFILGDREIARLERYSRPLCALMLDLDHFKQVNDTFGHAVGDVVLREVALICQKNLRKPDILGRYGGEEFAVILPETDMPAAIQTAERLRQAIAGLTFTDKAQDLRITVSIGITPYHSGDTMPLLLDRADTALYTAKQNGRNQVCWID